MSVQRIIFLGLSLRIAVAAWNGFIGPSYGAGADAIHTYHPAAVYWLECVLEGFRIGLVYSYALGIFYDLVGHSLFLGCLLSCLAWLLSALLLKKIMQLLSFDALCQYKAMLIYALLPSSIMFTSVTLKEAFQLLFVNLAIYSALKIFFGKSNRHWLLLLCATISMSVMHPTFYVFGLFIIVATIASYSFRINKLIFKKALLIFFSIVLILYFGFQFRYIFNIGRRAAISTIDGKTAITTENSPTAKDLSKIENAVKSFQQGLLKYHDVARTFYKTSVNFHGMSGLLASIPLSLFQYLFEPMPWHISSILDLEAIFENILRAWLIFMALFAFRSTSGNRRVSWSLVFLSYIILETIWSLGTLNWGTAIRHHVPAVGLLVVAAFASSGKQSRNNAVLETTERIADVGQKEKKMLSNEKKRKILLFLIIIALGLVGRMYYLFLRERTKNFNLIKQQDEINFQHSVSMSELDIVKRNVIAGLEKNLSDAQMKITDLSNEIDEEKSFLSVVLNEIEELKLSLNQETKKKISIQKELDASVVAFKSMESQIKKMETKIKQLESNKKGLVSQLEGRITTINNDHNFVVIDLGSKDGVALGNIFSVSHENSNVGDLKIEMVQERMSTAGFVSSGMKEKISTGDKVTLREGD